MTPKEQAKELVDRYLFDDLLYYDLDLIQAKKCALIAVAEILRYFRDVTGDIRGYFYSYWKEVRQEIEKL